MSDDVFAANLAEWGDFYVLTGTAAATLLGLVFIALSLRPGVMADHGPIGLRAFAGQTFGNLLIVLVIALICLIPHQSSETLGVTLLLISLFDLMRAAHRFRTVQDDPDPVWRSRTGLMRFVLPATAHFFMLLVAVDMLFGDGDALAWLITSIFILVADAAGGAWHLLTEMGRRHDETESSSALVSDRQ